MFEGRKVSDRIVSIDRHYVRPIVRGKETKSVEFGAKVNNIQIDGISFIEHLSFKAFNEGIRSEGLYPYAAETHEREGKMRGCRCHILPTMPTESSARNTGISTSFVRKGRAAKDEPLEEGTQK